MPHNTLEDDMQALAHLRAAKDLLMLGWRLSSSSAVALRLGEAADRLAYAIQQQADVLHIQQQKYVLHARMEGGECLDKPCEWR